MNHILNFLFITLTSFCCASNLSPLDPQETYPIEIYMESDENEIIGSGTVHQIKDNVAPLSLKKGFNGRHILTIKIDSWTLEFSFINETLDQGFYFLQEHSPYISTNPILNIYGRGGRCNKIEGQFAVIDVIYNESNQIISLALDFIQYCNSSTQQLKGYVRFNSRIPVPKIEYPLNISMFSPKSEYIGQGSNYFYQTKLRGLSNAFTNNPNVISLNIGGYYFEFSAPKNEIITEGYYKNAIRYPFHQDEPAISVSGNGRGCNKIEGEFHVISIEYDTQNVITMLAIDFIQYCETKKSKPLVGSVRYNSKLSLSSENELLLKFDGLNAKFDFSDYYYFEDFNDEDEDYFCDCMDEEDIFEDDSQ